MAKKNIYLLLILLVSSISVVADSLLGTTHLEWSPSSAIAGLFILFFVYAWCIEHAKHYKIKIPGRSAFWAAAIPPIGVPIYFFRGFGFKKGFFKTIKFIGFLILILVGGTFALWVADDPIFHTSNTISQHAIVSDDFDHAIVSDDFDNENYKSAFAGLQDLAILDNASAQSRVAWMYYNGQGVEQDYKQALYWYTRAAEQNYPPAQLDLGDMYLTGNGVDVDIEKAKYWLGKAEENGVAEAQEILDILENIEKTND